MILLRYAKRLAPSSDRQNRKTTVITCLIMLVWLAGLVIAWSFWRSLPLYAKVGLTVVEGLITPTWGDLVQLYRGQRAPGTDNGKRVTGSR